MLAVQMRRRCCNNTTKHCCRRTVTTIRGVCALPRTGVAERCPAARKPGAYTDKQEEKAVIALGNGIGASLAVLLAVGLTACAPQQTSSGAASRGTPSSQAAPGQGMSSMQGHSMAGMDHQSFMAHCAQMRQATQQGARLSADMQQMMTQCDQMERSMGSQRTR
jgi:hypothetical protein